MCHGRFHGSGHGRCVPEFPTGRVSLPLQDGRPLEAGLCRRPLGPGDAYVPLTYPLASVFPQSIYFIFYIYY